jgi:hypothetical protein
MASRARLDVARAPLAPAGARLYESHYVTAVAPGAGRAVWLRYTAHKERGERPRGSLWCTVFAAGGPLVARRTPAPAPLAPPPAGAWAQIDGAVIAPGRAAGTLGDCDWSLAWSADALPLPYLPSAWLYDRPLPRSNGVALVPSATFSGHLAVGDERLDLGGWRGMVGHNWGADHPDRWIWLHATGLGERDPGGWLDVVLARVRLGPLLSPWMATGALRLDGRLHRVRPGPAARGLRVEIAPEALQLVLPHACGGGLAVAASAPAASTVRWDYASPGGGGRQVRNCSIASARITVGAAPAFEVRAACAVEVGGPTS